MSLDHPLRFEPIFRRYLWGGRRLETVLGKPLPEGDDYAESWEVVDHHEDQSRVAFGPLRGRTLHELVVEHPHELFGEASLSPQFPLLFKWLDANQDLSLQVHPNDTQAAGLTPPDHGKTEAWVIVHAAPGSVLHAGLKNGVDRAAVEQAIANDTLEQCLHKLEPQVGDCIFIPAGTPHAIGAGLVVAEIQQASDTTFRLFDWNRVGPDGQPRPLHVEQGLGVLDFQAGPAEPRRGEPTRREFITQLVHCEKFVLDRWRLNGPHLAGGDGRFHIIAVTSGELRLDDDLAPTPLAKGQTAVIPASAGAIGVRPLHGNAELLDMYLP